MICKNCGREIDDTSKFCGYCGNKVEVVTPESIIFPDVNDKAVKPVDFEAPTVPDYSWISETAPKPVYEAPKPVEPVYEAPKPVEPVYEAPVPTPKPIEQPVQPVATQPQENSPAFVFDKPENNPISAYEGFNINNEQPTNVSTPKEEVDMTPFSDVVQQPVQPVEQPRPVEPVYEAPKPVEPVYEAPVPTPKPVEQLQPIEKENKKATNKKDFTSFIIVFLIIVVIMLSGFIAWDKFLNKEAINNGNVNQNTTNMTEKDANDIASDKYNSVYGDNFKLIYDSVIAGDTTNAKSLFTEECIEKMKNDTNYTTGIFGTTNQEKRDLTVISYGDEYITVKGKNATDITSYYMTLRKVDGMWYIDMYE